MRRSDSQVVDQMVVSVGPYMFRSFPGTSARNSFASFKGRASPPTISTDRRDKAARPAASATSIDAMEGVHCR